MRGDAKAMAKVRCRDSKAYSGERCEVKMKYMNPDTPRYCLHFEHKGQQSLPIYDILRYEEH